MNVARSVAEVAEGEGLVVFYEEGEKCRDAFVAELRLVEIKGS